MTYFHLYDTADFFMVRTALLPFKHYLEIDQAIDPKKALFDFYCQHELFQEAVAIASPSLHQSLKGLKQGFFSVELNKSYLSLLKYFLRMCSRTTPFGLFSCVGWGQFAQQSHLSLDFSSLKKRVKPDMEWVKNLFKSLDEQQEIIKNFHVMANPNLIRKGGKIHLIKKNETKKTRDLATIRSTSASETILALACSPILYADLERKLVHHFPHHEPEKISACLNQLFQKEYLLSELSFRLDRPFNLSELMNRVSSMLPSSLDQLDALLKKYEVCPIGQGLSRLEESLEYLNQWRKVDYPLHVDAFVDSSTFTLTHKIQEKVSQAATALWLLSPQRSRITALSKYHQEFLEKYDTNRLIPLSELLHEVKGLGMPQEEATTQKEDIHLKKWLLSKISAQEIVIDELIHTLSKNAAEKTLAAPLSLELYFDLITESTQNLDEGNYIIALNPVVASMQAGSTFGRFLSLWDDATTKTECVHQLLLQEEALYDQAVFVEASFLPENPHTANVCYFEKVRTFQLQMYYREASDRQIDLDDLYVGATPERLYLYSKRLKKEIHVCLSSAVNPELAPAYLKFVLDVSQSRFHSFSPYLWEGVHDVRYLPRIKYLDLILCPARWYFNLDQLELKKQSDPKVIEAILGKALNDSHVPDFVYLTYFDHRLLIYWSNPDHFKLLCQHLTHKGEIILFEYLASYHHCMKSEKGVHVAEFVLPLIKNQIHSVPKDIDTYPKIEEYAIQKRLSVFEKKWIYAKLFLPQDEEEDFVKNRLMPFTHHLMQEQKMSRWFYVRYHENQAHIRLRLQSSSEETYDHVARSLSEWSADLLSQGVIRHVSWHIYERELERYGGLDCIEEAEDLFFADSECCCQLLRLPSSLLPLTVYAALGIIHFLKHFDEQIPTMIQLLAPIEKEAALLAGLRPHMKNIIHYAQELFFYEQIRIEDPLLLPLNQVFNLSTSSIHAYRRKIEVLDTLNALQNTKSHLIDSLLHMHCNRLLGIDSRLEKQARVIAYHILKKIHYQQQALMAL